MMLLDEQDEVVEEAKPVALSLLRHQAEFINDTTTRELALIGGFGCGKTEALCYKAITLAAYNAPYVDSDTVNFLIEPNDAQIRNLLRPRFEKILGELQIPYTMRLSPRVEYILHFAAGDVKIVLAPAGAGADAFRGFQAAFIGVDEADTIDPDRLRELWVSLTSRLRGCREGVKYQLFATSTPEGFNFCYQNWVEDIEVSPDLAAHRRLVKGKTKWNPYLPTDYVDNLKRQYPAALLAAYLEGEFVNLEGNIVYTSFDRTINATTKTLGDLDPNQILHIGVDFNNNKTCGIVHVIGTDGLVYAVDEIVAQKNTNALINEIKARYPNRVIMVYPDAAGRQMTTNADQSNIELLRQHFTIKAHANNPRVSDRVTSVNAMFCNGKEQRRYFVNLKKCPTYVKSLEQQKYINGEPDKKHDQDHPVDAAGYFIWFRFPIVGAPTLRIC